MTEEKNVTMTTEGNELERDKKFFDTIFWGGFLILAGLAFSLDYMGYRLATFGNGEWWGWVFLIAGIYGAILTYFRVTNKNYSNPNTFDYIGVEALFLIGIGALTNIDIAWPFILVLAGAVILGSQFLKKN